MPKAKRHKNRPRFPVIRVMCVLVGCMTTLIGVTVNLSPDVILYRVTLAVVVTALVISITQSLTQIMHANT